MKVLYLGHYRESTGWAQAAIDYILALDSVGVDVVCRNVSLTGKEGSVPPKILELESKDTRDCDVCIQHLLPHHLVGTKRFKKNIAFFVSESTSIKTIPWFVDLHQMDEVWVPNKDLWQSLINDGLVVPNSLKVVPHTFNMDKYKSGTQQISIEEINHKFKFYYIGDLNDRKNLPSIIRCFHSEFDKSEPVSLILKIRRFGSSPEQVKEIVNHSLREIKSRLRMYPQVEDYITEVVIPEDIDGEGIKALHQYGDCFLSPTHGEAWSIPSFEAMAFGKTPICSSFGGPKDFIDKDNPSTGTCVGGNFSVCQCTDAAFPDIFTGREEWFSPSESEIKKAMRYYYENRDNIDRFAGLKQAEKFSYEVIGNMMKEYING
tara:strand:+ start:218 stop:1342 length:1125 start_codon:yes stop_codon:yes gene_type:complete